MISVVLKEDNEIMIKGYAYKSLQWSSETNINRFWIYDKYIHQLGLP